MAKVGIAGYGPPQRRQGKAVRGGTKEKISLILERLVTHFGGLGPLDLLEKSRRHDRWILL